MSALILVFMYWVKVDLTQVAEFARDQHFVSYVWDLAERKQGPEYEQARFHKQSLGVISEPPGYVAQVDWASCRKCKQRRPDRQGPVLQVPRAAPLSV